MSYRTLNPIHLRTALADIEPSIWRQLIVPLTSILPRCTWSFRHPEIGCLDYHLHEFMVGAVVPRRTHSLSFASFGSPRCRGNAECQFRTYS